MSSHTIWTANDSCCSRYCIVNPLLELSWFTALIACYRAAQFRVHQQTEMEEQEALIVLKAAWLMALSPHRETNLKCYSQQQGHFIHNHIFIRFLISYPESSTRDTQICISGGFGLTFVDVGSGFFFFPLIYISQETSVNQRRFIFGRTISSVQTLKYLKKPLFKSLGSNIFKRRQKPK